MNHPEWTGVIMATLITSAGFIVGRYHTKLLSRWLSYVLGSVCIAWAIYDPLQEALTWLAWDDVICLTWLIFCIFQHTCVTHMARWPLILHAWLDGLAWTYWGTWLGMMVFLMHKGVDGYLLGIGCTKYSKLCWMLISMPMGLWMSHTVQQPWLLGIAHVIAGSGLLHVGWRLKA
jgi:hypothetical protein